MDPHNTDRLLTLMKTAGRYCCRLNHHMHNTGKAMDRAEYEKRSFNNPPRPEDLQVMRYLARLDYADIYLLMMAAQAYCSERGNSGVTDGIYIKQILKKLLDTGLVHERRYVDDAETDSEGRPLTTEKTPIFYCLSGYGQHQYKDLSCSTEFLEEFLFTKSEFEIMRRLAGNYAVLKCRREFAGEYVTAASEKVEKLGRMPVYGRYENSGHWVIFEPVFFDYNPSYINEEDFKKQLRIRARFIKKVLEAAPQDKTKSLVLIVETREHLKEAFIAYEGAAGTADIVYATSENALSVVSAQEGETRNAFLKVSPASEGRISIIAEPPVFFE